MVRYGHFVSYESPLTPLTWLLWGGPLAVVILGEELSSAAVVRRWMWLILPFSKQRLRNPQFRSGSGFRVSA